MIILEFVVQTQLNSFLYVLYFQMNPVQNVIAL